MQVMVKGLGAVVKVAISHLWSRNHGWLESVVEQLWLCPGVYYHVRECTRTTAVWMHRAEEPVSISSALICCRDQITRGSVVHVGVVVSTDEGTKNRPVCTVASHVMFAAKCLRHLSSLCLPRRSM